MRSPDDSSERVHVVSWGYLSVKTSRVKFAGQENVEIGEADGEADGRKVGAELGLLLGAAVGDVLGEPLMEGPTEGSSLG